MVEINWIAVVVGTVGYMVLGMLWYGPLFGARWLRSMGYESKEDMVEEKGMEGKNPNVGYALTTVGSLAAAIALAILVDWVGATTWQMGMTVGAVVGVGFVATTALQAVPFEGRAWPTYVLNVGYNVVALAGIGALLAVW